MTDDMRLIDPIERMLERLNVSSVFGTPTEAGGVTVIPVAEIRLGFGYGFGSSTTAETGDAEAKQPGTPGGMGGGGGAAGGARPIGFIRVAPDGVEFEPLVDVPRISRAGIMLAGWSLFWILYTMRVLRRGK